MDITVLGAGAWGTSIATILAKRHGVVLWDREEVLIQEMHEKRENKMGLPGVSIPVQLNLEADFDAAVKHASKKDALLIIATSVAGLRPVIHRLRHAPITNLIWLCKGFEEDTGAMPHQVIAEELPDRIRRGVLSGPSFAQEVAAGLPCALTIASDSPELRQLVAEMANGSTIRIYSSDDVIGVEVGGAVKNILAIAAGISDGSGFGMNARAALITRGLVEITRLGMALGGRQETFMGLTGMGDLLLTCTGDLSRNRQIGLAMAAGKPLAQILAELGHVAEGVRCASVVRSLAAELNIEMPIVNAVAGILFDKIPITATVAQLLSRNMRDEVESFGQD